MGLALKVAFQGELGAYSEEAAHKFFHRPITTIPMKTLSEVFRLVESKAVDYGIVPIENSLEGSISQVYDLFLNTKVMVCGEVILKINHCLIALPNARREEIRYVYSHPIALAQCQSYIESFGYEPIFFRDTAGSAKLIKEKSLLDSAAIASRRVAELYGMRIIDEGIQDSPENYTRFFVLSLKDSPPTGSDKTSVVFSTKHVPGALYSVLHEFAVRNVNLTKIESRPRRSKPSDYHFYVDFEGHRKEEAPKTALKGVKAKARFLRILGSYPRAIE